MRKSRGSGASVAGSVIVSVIISAALIAGVAYVALPSIYPTLNPPKESKILQVQYKQWTSVAYIFDNQLTYSQMNQTTMLITVKAGSCIYASFTAPLILSLDGTFTGLEYYNLSLVIGGVGNMTTPIIYYDGSAATGNFRQITYNPTIQFMTGALSAGTYNISIQWRSTVDASGFNSLGADFYTTPTNYYLPQRTLFVEEIVK